MRQQQTVETVHSARAEIGQDNTRIIRCMAAIEQPVAARRAQMRRAAKLLFGKTTR